MCKVIVGMLAVLLASSAWATYVEDTIADTMGQGSSPANSWYRGTNTDDTHPPSAAVNEDNEVEPGMQWGQKWDLEAVLYDRESQSLTLIGGWNFITDFQGWESGDVFLAVNEEPEYGATAPYITGATTTHDYDYTYALDVDWANQQFGWVTMVPDTTVQLTVYGGSGTNSGSNPWRLNDDYTGTLYDFDSGSYTDTEGPPDWLDGAADGLLGSSDNTWGAASFTHYWVTFDLSSFSALDAEGTYMYVHNTMECGNDDLMGYVPDTSVPEPISMVMLGCLGAGMLGGRAMRRRRVEK